MNFEKTFSPSNPLDLFNIINLLNKLPKNKTYYINVIEETEGSVKSQKQHNWFFLKRIKPLAKEIGVSPTELYTQIKQEFGFITTSDMTTEDFTEFVHLFDIWAAEFHNFTFEAQL